MAVMANNIRYYSQTLNMPGFALRKEKNATLLVFQLGKPISVINAENYSNNVLGHMPNL